MRKSPSDAETERKAAEVELLKAQAELLREQARTQRIENDITEKKRIEELPQDEQVKYYTAIIRNLKRYVSFSDYHDIVETVAREKLV